ncbi:hypothetical protein [Streptomyces sp. NPDC127114]
MTTKHRFTEQQRARRSAIADAAQGLPTPPPAYPPTLSPALKEEARTS